MAAAFLIISVVCLWTAGLADWIVAYATGVAQLGIWLTLLSLVPFATVWVSLKQMPFTQMPSSTAHAHWSLHLKVSFHIASCFCIVCFLWCYSLKID